MNRVLVTALVIAIVSGCGSSGSTASPGPATTAGTTNHSASAKPSVAPTRFPIAAFAALIDDLLPEDAAAKFQAALADTARGGGIAATVMTAEGTWSGAAGKADGVHDLEIASQFGIASGTKPIVAAQVMMMVEAGEIDLDHPATEYLLLAPRSTPTAQRSVSS